MSLPNRDHWDQLAGAHGASGDRYYDLERLKSGGTLMSSAERGALDIATGPPGLRGLRVAHLQSHIGCDAISMAREGALVTAIDFSPVALERAAALAKDCGVSLSCFLADSRNLPAELNDCFDIVYATIGVLCWIDNIDAWSDGVTRILAPGGRLVLVDLHPLYQMLDTLEPPVFEFPYNFDGVRTYDSQGSYANRDLPIRSVTEQSAHGLAEIVMSLVRAGLTLLDLRELLSSDFDIGGSGLECGADGRYRLRIGSGVQGAPAEPLPVLFSLVAERTK